MSTIHDAEQLLGLRQANALTAAEAEWKAWIAEWLDNVSRWLPVGTLVKGSTAGAAVKYPGEEFSGFGTVVGYVVGATGDCPFVLVRETKTGNTRLVWDNVLALVKIEVAVLDDSPEGGAK